MLRLNVAKLQMLGQECYRYVVSSPIFSEDGPFLSFSSKGKEEGRLHLKKGTCIDNVLYKDFHSEIK